MSDYKNNDLSKKISILKQTNHTEMNITVEQLVNFGRFPYSKGRLTKEDHDIVNDALDLLQLQDIEIVILSHYLVDNVSVHTLQ